MLAAMVECLPAWRICQEKVLPTERTMTTAIVSPRARPRPSIEAEMTPERPNGRTAMRTISQRVAPSARAASSWRGGVWRKTSRDTEVMIGNTMTARIRAAEAMTRPVGDAGPAKRGNQPTCSANHVQRGTSLGINQIAPHRP